MYKDNNDFFIKRFGITDVSVTDLKEYLELTQEGQNSYKEECFKHPEWNHNQIISKLAIDKALQNVDIMRGVGFDIANSNNLTDKQKEELIKACEDYYYKSKSFSTYERSLLFKVRDEYHIRNYGLCELVIG